MMHFTKGLMTRRAVLAASAAPLLRSAAAKPNIVFLITDDHHWQALGAAGNPHIKTPNIDRLASRGVLFTHGVISTPQCAPSRGILLSGLESYQNGLDSNGHVTFRSFQGATIPKQLKDAGYQTSLIGKWHIKPTPAECGFSDAPLWLQRASSPYRDPMLRRGLDGQDEKTPGVITDLLSDAAVQTIQSAKKPYLLWLAYNAPHQPWYAGDAHKKLYAGSNARIAPPAHPKPAASADGAPQAGGNLRADGQFDWETYYAVITHLDEGIGRVIGAVEKSGQWENTLIVLVGDNGYLCGQKGLQGKVVPWDQSIRVPYIVSGGLVKKAGKSDAMAASVDLPATFLDYAGVRSSHKLTGQTLRPVLEGRRFSREAAFASWNDGRPEALAVKRSVEPYRVARTSGWKYIVWESGKEALFDLAADSGEENNLAGDTARSRSLEKMKSILTARMKATSDPALAWLTRHSRSKAASSE